MTDDPFIQGGLRGYDEEAGREPPALSANGTVRPGDEPPPAVGDLVGLDRIASRAVDWFWYPWLPVGFFAILDGDPGRAKSTLSLDLAARTSRGWGMPPDGGGDVTPPAGVLLLSAEDDPGCTIRPRLEAAGADVRRVFFFRSVKQGETSRPPVLPWDLDLVAERVKADGIVLVVIDPFSAFISADFDMHRDQDIRHCLHYLALFARDTSTVLLLVRHLNKLGSGPALYRGGGSIAITGASRASLIVGRDPEEPTRHVLAMNKSNLGPTPRSLTYTIEQATPGVTRIAWGQACDLTAEDILWHQNGRTPGRPDDEVTAAVEFLEQILAKGSIATVAIKADAVAAVISWRTVERAKAQLKVWAYKDGEGWYWKLRNT